MIPRTRRGRLAVFGLLLALVGAGVVAQRHAIWRAAYPHLPRQVQAAPYRLMSMGEAQAPVAMPTAARPASPMSGAGEPGVGDSESEQAAGARSDPDATVTSAARWP